MQLELISEARNLKGIIQALRPDTLAEVNSQVRMVQLIFIASLSLHIDICNWSQRRHQGSQKHVLGSMHQSCDV